MLAGCGNSAPRSSSAPIRRNWRFFMVRLHGTADGSLARIQIAILAKAPIAGLAKTRLIPALGPKRAARLHRSLTRHTVRCAMEADLGQVTLWCTPNAEHRFFRALRRTAGLPCLVQTSGDLGARMHMAFRLHCFEGPLLLIGTDCPMLTAEHLREAARQLIVGADAVFYPAEDGGYVLVGLRRPQAALFEEMPWGTSDVMALTRERASRAGLKTCELETLWDVDQPVDVMRLRALRAQTAP